MLGDNFDTYLRRNGYFEMNKVTDENFKIQLLVNLLGPCASAKVMNSFLPKDYSKET